MTCSNKILLHPDTPEIKQPDEGEAGRGAKYSTLPRLHFICQLINHFLSISTGAQKVTLAVVEGIRSQCESAELVKATQLILAAFSSLRRLSSG